MITTFKKFGIITESPDSVYDIEIDDYYKSEDMDAIPFSCVVNSDHTEIVEIYYGKAGEYHEKMKKLGGRNKAYPGRIWTESKVMSFWVYPNEELFKSIVHKMEDDLSIEIFNNDWRIEVVTNDGEVEKTKFDKKNKKDFYFYKDIEFFNAELISVEEYAGSENIPDDIKKWHIMNWYDKEDAKKRGEGPKWYGSDITSWDGPKNIRWRQQMYQENNKNEY